MSLIKECQGNTYYSFSNWEGKKWTIPVNNSKVALCLYEPSGIKGKMLKKFFNISQKMGVINKLLKGDYVNIDISQNLQNILINSFGEDLEYSLFWGTPCIDQKITIQVYRGKTILGYCKIGHSERTKQLFEHEKRILNKLQNSNMKHVPKCIFEGTVGENNVFLQNTEKDYSSTTLSGFSEIHEKFLQNLYQNTSEIKFFEETDFYYELIFLKNNLILLDSEMRYKVEACINDIMDKLKNKKVEWGIVHRDFTPWNTCFNGENLYVFDFEYALFNAPNCIDRCHFLFQKYYFENDKKSLEEIKKVNKYELIYYMISYLSLYLRRSENTDIVQANNRAKFIINLMDIK